jgi:hypothetical protein
VTDWTKLNAYVDGELDADGAAEVASAIARDPQLAARVATLSKLKATTAAMPVQAGVPPPAVLNAMRPRRSLFVRRVAIAASVLMMFGAAGTWLAWPRPTALTQTAQYSDNLNRAFAAHRAWIGETKAIATGAVAGDRIQIAPGSRELIRVPDLTATQLSLAHVSPLSDRTTVGGVLLGYVGPNGCRLGLWIADAGRSGFGPEVRDVSHDGTIAHFWQTGATNYAVVARGMDPARLSMMATAIAALVARDHQLDDGLRAKLQIAASQGGACVG